MCDSILDSRITMTVAAFHETSGTPIQFLCDYLPVNL